MEEQARAYAKQREKEAADYEEWWLKALSDKEKAEAQQQARAQERLQKQVIDFQNVLNTMEQNGQGTLVGDSFTKLKQDFEDFKSELGTLSTSDAQSKLDTLVQKSKDLKTEAKAIQKEMNAIAPSMKVEALKTKIESVLTFSKKISTETRNGLTNIYQSLVPDKTTNRELSNFNAQYNAFIEKAKLGGELGLSFGDKWKRGLSSLARYLTTFASFYRIVGYVKESFNTINELDYALVDLRKTADMTNDELNDFYRNATDVGAEMGTTTKEIIDQAAAWSRLNKIGLLYGNV